MRYVAFLAFLALVVLSLRGVRWAYATFILLSLLYFQAKPGFRLNPTPCQLALDLPLALFSLTNYAHIVLFALFFLITSAQFRTFAPGSLPAPPSPPSPPSPWAPPSTRRASPAAATAACAILVPDGAGVVLGGVIMTL